MITPTDFRDALADGGNRRVINAFRREFGDRIRGADWDDLARKAVLGCLATYDPSRGRAFKNSLANYLRWECLRALRGQARYRARFSPLGDAAEPAHQPDADVEHLRECLGLLDPGDRDLIRRCYFEGVLPPEEARGAVLRLRCIFGGNSH